MASAWAPDEGALEQLLQCLRLSGSADTSIQAQVKERLESFNDIPEYNSYLTFILTQMRAEDETVRSVAGLVLKNNIRSRLDEIPAPVLEYIKTNIFSALNDSVPMIRGTVSTVIDQLVCRLHPANWPDALRRLIELLDSPDTAAQEGAFSTIDKICQDIPKELEGLVIDGSRPLDFMIPKFLQHINSPTPRIRMHALSSALQFVTPDNNALTLNLEPFVRILFEHATDTSSDVRKLVCQSLVALLATRADVLIPHLPNVIDFMLYSTKDTSDEEVALEACEFWLTFAEDPDLVQHLRPFIPKVIPVLLDSMVYSEDDLLILDTDAEDAAVPDKASDIKPHLLSSRAHVAERAPDAEGQPNGQGPSTSKARGANGFDADEDDDEYEDEEDEDEDEAYTEWNLRKCSAAALDVMAVQFETDLLETLLPILKNKLFASEWTERESGILALGAVAEGCISGIEPHLPVLMELLIGFLSDAKPLVRSITCWTIGRYSSWTIKEDATPEHKQQFFVPVMEGLLRMCLDNNKRVQEAGCSAFATLEEEAGEELKPFLGSILGNLVFAFSKYQQKNLLILYDALGTLADAVGPALNDPAYLEILLPPLINRWERLQDSDPDLIPLLECMSSVVIAIGPGFAAYARPVFDRCIRIVHQQLADYQSFVADPENIEEPDRTCLIVSLDLLSGLTQGLGASVGELFQQSNPPLLVLLKLCLDHPDPPVRQSSYALLGDCAISCFPLLKGQLAEFMPRLINHIEVEPRAAEISVSNNAAWAAGEIAMQLQSSSADMEPWVQPIMSKVVPVLLSPKAARSLIENSAVTIGRLALVCPAQVGQHLEVFASAWCTALADIKDNEEKDSAFRGMCSAIQHNPAGLAPAFAHFLNAVARWTRPSPQLNEMFRTILHAFRQQAGPSWDQQLGHLPAPIVTRLKERYQI